MALVMTRRQMVWGSLLAGVCAGWARGQGQQGRTAQRIVSTAPSLTESLFAMGLGPQVVGVSQYCEWPAEVLKLPKVGSYIQPNIEAIVRLRPDLVLLERASTEVVNRLTSFGIGYAEIPHGTLADTFAGMEKIATAAGVGERGTALVAKVKGQLGAVEAKAQKRERVRVMMIADRTPGTLGGLVAVGPNNYENELLELAGGLNVLTHPAAGSVNAGALKVLSYPRISLETVLRENPDVLIDLTDAHDTDAAHIAARRADLELWWREQGLKAAREHRVYMADSTVFLVPGPRMAEAAERLYEALHGGPAQ